MNAPRQVPRQLNYSVNWIDSRQGRRGGGGRTYAGGLSRRDALRGLTELGDRMGAENAGGERVVLDGDGVVVASLDEERAPAARRPAPAAAGV